MKKPMSMLVGFLVVVIIGLAVGLGVESTRRANTNDALAKSEVKVAQINVKVAQLKAEGVQFKKDLAVLAVQNFAAGEKVKLLETNNADLRKEVEHTRQIARENTEALMKMWSELAAHYQAEVERDYCESLAKRPTNTERAPIVFCGESLPVRSSGPVDGTTQPSPSIVTEEKIRQFCRSGLEQMQICSTIIQQYGGDAQAYCRNSQFSISKLVMEACERLGFGSQNSLISEEATKEKLLKQRAKFVFCDEEWRKLNQKGRALTDHERKVCESNK